MNKRFITICSITALIMIFSGTTQALPTTLVDVVDYPTQDPLVVPLDVHELGNLFPQDEAISSQQGTPSEHRPCLVNPDDVQIPNPLVFMTNLGSVTWTDVWYVADLETSLENYDGKINGGYAFKIDNIGNNTPLVYESITYDNIFEPGEQWGFVIQDYYNTLSLAPELLGSQGVGAFSGAGLTGASTDGIRLSSGSIIAIPAPGAILLGSLGVGLVGWLRRKKTL